MIKTKNYVTLLVVIDLKKLTLFFYFVQLVNVLSVSNYESQWWSSVIQSIIEKMKKCGIESILMSDRF